MSSVYGSWNGCLTFGNPNYLEVQWFVDSERESLDELIALFCSVVSNNWERKQSHTQSLERLCSKIISVCSQWVDGSKGELSLQSQLTSRHVNMILDLKDEAASKMGMWNLREMKTGSGNPCPSFGVMIMVITSYSHCAKTLFLKSIFSVSSSPRRLDANHINYVPPNCFNGLVSLRHLWLDDNSLTEIPVQAFRSLPALQAMTLALNKIHYIPDYAFGNLSSLVVL